MIWLHFGDIGRVDHVEDRHQRTAHLSLQFFRHGSGRRPRALAAADLDASELDLILLGSLTNDSMCPNTASLVADALGARNAAALDINSACTGFLYGLHIGTNLIRTGAHQKVLVIGGEFISHYMNWARRDVAVLFGDACGAVILEASDQPVGLISAKIGCEADAKYAIQITNLALPTRDCRLISYTQAGTLKVRRCSNGP